MKQFSTLLKTWPASGIREMLDMYRQYPDAVNMCNGDPDLPTPEHIVEAAVKSLRDGNTQYSTESGIVELREAVAAKYVNQFGFDFTPENVMATAGSIEAMFIILAGILDSGDEVIVSDPSYTSYEGQVRMFGGRVVRVKAPAENGFLMNPEEIAEKITGKTRAVILNYPNNPSGTLIDNEYCDRLANALEGRDVLIISDEVYEKIVFDGKTHYSPMQHPQLKEKVLIANSLSKTYAMTGWRLGYILGSGNLVSGFYKMQQALISCLPIFVQHAGVAALNGSQDCVEQMRREYERRRNIICNKFDSIENLDYIKSGGSLGIMADIRKTGISSRDFSLKLLSEGGVLTVPGTAFGKGAEGWIRLAFANSAETMTAGAERFSEYFNNNLNFRGNDA